MREMKDSGIEWIGKIPKEWAVSKVKYFYDCYDGKRVPIDAASREDGPYPYWGAGSITDYVSDYLFDEEIVLVGEDGAPFFDHTRPVSFLVNEKVWVNNHIHVLKAKNVNASYLVYFFNTVDYGSYINGSILNKLTQSSMNNISFCVPSEKEQAKIVEHLDAKCAQIDSIISKQEAIIEKLKEYKLSVITEAVTKGLNPEVEMKDSGIEWIGTIPIDWHIVKLSTIAKTSSGATPNRSNFEENFIDANIRWIRTLDLNDWYVYDSSEKITESALSKSSCQIMPVNTVCVAMYGGAGTIGKCGLLKEEAATNQAICSIVTGCKMRPEYLLLQLHAIRKYWMKYAVGTRKDPNISQEIVSRMQVVLPPVDVQEDIIKKIMPLCEVIDTQIRKVEDIIEKQKELKKSLIYEVVTGKKEV